MTTDDAESGRATYRVHSDTGRGGVWSTTYVLAESWERAMDAVKEERDGHAVSAVYETDRPAEDAQLDAREVLDDLVTDGGREGSHGIDYIETDELLIPLPLRCRVCGGEPDRNKGLIPLSDGEPVCQSGPCVYEADEVVYTEHHSGYPNNNVGLDLDSATRWLKIKTSDGPGPGKPERFPVDYSRSLRERLFSLLQGGRSE